MSPSAGIFRSSVFIPEMETYATLPVFVCSSNNEIILLPCQKFLNGNDFYQTYAWFLAFENINKYLTRGEGARWCIVEPNESISILIGWRVIIFYEYTASILGII